MFVKSAFAVDYERLRRRRGIKALIFDIDNTIAPFDVADPPEEASAFLAGLKALGFRICLLSNGGRRRVERFNRGMGLHAVHRAGKPGPLGLRKALRLLRAGPRETALIGDQVFTDVLCGNIWGLYTILVRPVSGRDEFSVRLKRGIEKQVIRMYKKKWRSYHGKGSSQLYGGYRRKRDGQHFE